MDVPNRYPFSQAELEAFLQRREQPTVSSATAGSSGYINPVQSQASLKLENVALSSQSQGFNKSLKKLQLLCEQRNSRIRDMQAILDGDMNQTNQVARASSMAHTRDRFFGLQLLIDELECGDETGMLCDLHRAEAEERVANIYKRFVGQADPSDRPAQTPLQYRPHIPNITVPKFNGDITEWAPFKTYFDSLVHNNIDISETHKLHHLKTALSGTAAEVIRAVPLSDEGYRLAYKLLCDQYCNSQRVANAHYRALSGKKLPDRPNAEELFELINTHKAAMAGLQEQALPNLSDYLGLQVTLSRLDVKIRAEYEGSLAPNEFPSSDSFQSFIHAKARVLETLSRATPSVERRPNNKAVLTAESAPQAVTNLVERTKGKACFYCQSANHLLVGCPHFHQLDSQTRVSLLTENKLCVNCFGRHNLKNCPSSVGCRVCGWRTHHTSLHGHFNTSNVSPKRSSQAVSATNNKLD